MSRNFGIVTGLPASGAQPPTGPHYSADKTRADIHSNVISLVGRLPPLTDRLNSQAQEPEPFIHPFELGSHLLFLALLFLPWVIVGGLVFTYLLIVA